MNELTAQRPIDTQMLLPIGVIGSDLKPLAKAVALYLWHQSGCFHRAFHVHPGEVLSWFCVRGSRASDNVFSMLRDKRLIEVHERNAGGRLLVEITENIWRLPRRSAHPSLELFEPPAEFGGNPLLPRLLVPEAFLGSPTINATQKLIGWYSIWQGDVPSKTVRLVHSEVARDLAMDRSNLRKASLSLAVADTAFFLRVDENDPLMLRWSERVFSDQQRQNLQWLSSSNVTAAQQFLELLYEVNGAHGIPHGDQSMHGIPRGEVNGAHGIPRGEVDCVPVLPHASESVHEIPRDEVVCAPVLPHSPGSVHQIPQGEVNGAPVLPHATPARGLQNINDSKYQSLNESLEIGGNGESQTATQLRESCNLLIKQVNLKGAYRWFVLAVVMLRDTNELLVNGEAVGLTQSDLATLVESCVGKNGQYFTGALKRRLAELLSPDTDFRSLSDDEQKRRANAVKLPGLQDVREAAKRIGYAWNEDRMREKVQTFGREVNDEDTTDPPNPNRSLNHVQRISVKNQKSPH